MDKHVKYIIYVCIGLLAAGSLLTLSITLGSKSQIEAQLTRYTPAWSVTGQNVPDGGSNQPGQTQGETGQGSTAAPQWGTNPPRDTEAVPASGADEPADTSAEPSSSQMLKIIEDAVNAVKKANNFTAVKKQEIDIKLTDCSAPSLKDTINAIIKKIAQNKTVTYTFVDGTMRESGGSITPDEAIPPTLREFVLDERGVKSVTCESDGGNTVYTVTLVRESATLESPAPPYRSLCMDYLNLADYDLGAVKITKADILYEEAEITVTLDGTGRAVKYRELMPISGTGEGSLVLAVSGTLDGYLDEEWSFVYD